MFSNHYEVDNLVQQVLLSQDTRTAQQILMYLFTDCIAALEQEPQNLQLYTRAYTVIQAYCTLGLPWQPQFTAFLSQVNLPEPEQAALRCKPTRQALSQLIQWHTCRKNPLQPNKQELVQAIYEICSQPCKQRDTYMFCDGKHSYKLYYAQNIWHWQDVRKQLTWKLQS